MALGQALSCILYGATGLLLGWESGAVQAIAAAMALLFVYLPGLLWRTTNQAFNRGRYRWAADLGRSRALLQWDPEARHEARILAIWERIAAGKASAEEAEALSSEPASSQALRWVQVAGLVRLGRFFEAARLFESSLGWGLAEGSPNAVHLVKAYAEQGRMAEAFRALRALEPWRSVPEARAQILERLAFFPELLGRKGQAPPPSWALRPEEETLLDSWFKAPPPESRGPAVAWRQGRLATRIVLALCAATFAASLLKGDGLLAPKISTLVTFGGDVPSLVAEGEWWRLVSAIFLHAGVLHLALNAYALWILGELVEGLFGRRGFWLLFLLSGIAGTSASAWMARAPVAVGASGGVFGLLGASLGLLLARRGVFPAGQRKGMLRHMLLLTGANLLLGLSIPQVDNTAHLGGLAMGFLLGILLHPVALPDCPPWQARLQALLAALGAVLVLAAGTLAVRNALGQGYPFRPGLRVEVRVEGFRMSRPAWWKGWSDGMGIAFEYRGAFRPGSAELEALPKDLERVLPGPPETVWIGSRKFRRIAHGNGCLYLLDRRGLVHRWDLEAFGGWEEGGGDALARAMLETLEFPDDPVA